MISNLTGKYEGDIRVRFLPDGRWVELLGPYTFVDYKGKKWPVPAGAVVDGASIPQAFWTFIGGPFDEKYRDASIIHDWYCDLRTEPWEEVHHMFYQAMLTSGVPEMKARIMYAAVRWGGPRWEPRIKFNIELLMGNRKATSGAIASENSSLLSRASTALRQGKGKPTATQLELSESDIEALAERLGAADLSLRDVDALVDNVIDERQPAQLSLMEPKKVVVTRVQQPGK